ncbi:MAG: MFS transporter [Rhizobiales bacterium]|nr:MFS transporter [Hyphomicrobiales bacterium]
MSPRALFYAFALLWLCGIALRLPILSVPPVITAIQADLTLSGTEVGLLSALPVVVFGLFALPGSILVARFGVAATLAAGLLIGAVGAALRGSLLSTPVLFAATVVMAAGIAMMQVALPAAVRQWMPGRAGFATALYTNGLLLGEILPVALTIAFVLPLTGGSWRLSLAFWGLPLVAIAILTLLMAPKRVSSRRGNAPPVHWSPDWTEKRVWQFGLTFIGATSTYFGTNAFVPGYLETAGRSDLIGSVLTALNAGQMPVSLLLLVFAGRLARQPWSLPVVGIISLLCLLGIATTASNWTIVFAGMLGGMLAAALTLVLTLPVLYCDQEDIARVSAGMFMVGYAAAVVISVAGGAAWDISGAARAAFVPIALGILPLIVMPFLIHRRVQPAAA